MIESRPASALLVLQTFNVRHPLRTRTRDVVIRNREDTSATENAGGYTDLEVLEVIDPGRATRIRLRQARCVCPPLAVNIKLTQQHICSTVSGAHPISVT